MRHKSLLVIALAIVLSLGMLTPARARSRNYSHNPWLMAKNQKESKESPVKEKGEPDDDRPEKIDRLRKRVQTMFLWRAAEILDLNEEQEGKVFPIIKKYEQEIHQAFQERHKTKQGLRKAVKNKKPEEIKRLLSEFIKINEEIFKLRTQELADLKGILNTTQLANYTLFREDFEREVQEMIFSARQHKGRGEHGPNHKPGNEADDSSDAEEN